MPSPWFQFKPSNVTADSDQPMCMTFPALAEGQYSIIKDREHQFVLSEEKEAIGAVGVVVMVDRNSKVKLNVAANSSLSVRVNDHGVAKESTAELVAGNTMHLGDHKYTLCPLSSEISNLSRVIKEVVLCRMCNGAFKDPRLLKCGHSFCADCLTEKIQTALSSARNNELHLPAGVAAVAERDEILQQTRTITCVICGRKFSCWEASKAYKQPMLNQALPIMSTWVKNKESPECSVCFGTRCIVDVKDYEYCETCKRILCPVCAMEGHRQHNLRPRQAIVKAMHEHGKVIAAKKMAAANLYKQETALEAKVRANVEEADRLQNHVKQIVSEAYSKCSTMVSQFDAEKHPFMDSSADVSSRFSAQVEESEKQFAKVNAALDHLRKTLGEIANQANQAPKSKIVFCSQV